MGRFVCTYVFVCNKIGLIGRVLYDNPELMVMGSCVLVMLMKDEDVYIMNVGDSRAVVAQEVPKKGSLGSLNISVAHAQPNSIPAEEAEKTGAQDTSLFRLDLDKIIEETPRELERLQVKKVVQSLAPLAPASSLLNTLQLSSDHSTSILEVDNDAFFLHSACITGFL